MNARLRRVAQEVVGATSTDLLPFIALEHVESGTGRLLQDELQLRAPEPAGMVKVDPGDVLFGQLRPYLAKSLLVDRDALISAELIAIRPGPSLEGRWLAYLVQSRSFVAYAVSTSEGTKMPRTGWEKIRDFLIEVPSLAEQRLAANRLDADTAQSDQVIQGKLALRDRLEERLRCASEQLAGIDAADESWQLVPLMRLIDPRRPIMYGIVLPGPNVPDGVLLVKGGDVEAGRLRPNQLSRTSHVIESEHARSRIREGDVLYAIRGSYGAVAIAPPELDGANLTQDVARVAASDAVNARWLALVLRTPSVSSQLASRATGATIRGINIRDLKRAKIPVPPRSVQDALAERYGELERDTQNLIAMINKQTDALRERRVALITAALAGQIATPAA